MEFQKIEKLCFICQNCHTTIATPFNSKYRSDTGRLSRLICPCCSEDLSDIASSAFTRAYQYNEACEAANSFQNIEFYYQ